jgi:hypothetical protein
VAIFHACSAQFHRRDGNLTNRPAGDRRRRSTRPSRGSQARFRPDRRSQAGDLRLPAAAT